MARIEWCAWQRRLQSCPIGSNEMKSVREFQVLHFVMDIPTNGK